MTMVDGCTIMNKWFVGPDSQHISMDGLLELVIAVYTHMNIRYVDKKENLDGKIKNLRNCGALGDWKKCWKESNRKALEGIIVSVPEYLGVILHNLLSMLNSALIYFACCVNCALY